MKNIEHFMLPEHTNKLYENEAISSISLTRDVADKINELVDAYNRLSKIDLEWKQEQEGTIRKGVLYMKDNLLNSLNELMELLLDSGYVDKRINALVEVLSKRIDNLINGVSVDSEIIDVRVGYDGTIYTTAGDAVRDQIETLNKNKTNESDFLAYLKYKGIYHRNSLNLYNYETAQENTRLKSSEPNIGSEKSATDFYLTDYIPVDYGDILFASFNGVLTNVNGYCTYDANKNCIGYYMYFGSNMQDGVAKGTTIADLNAKYIRVEFKNTLGDYKKFQIQKDEVSSLEPYNAMQFFETPKKTVTIKADGTGNYTSIRNAFETEGENTIYYIHKGIYNVGEDITEEDMVNADYNSNNPNFIGLRFPNNSDLIGVGDKKEIVVRLELDSTKYTYDTRSNVATLNLFGDCTIENLTIVAVNARTPIHDDFAGASNSTHKIKNCILINEEVERATSHGYGLGLRSGLTVEIDGCEIYPTMIIHSNTNFKSKAKVIMNNVNIGSVLSIQDAESDCNTEVVLNNVSYGLLNFTGEVANQKMNVYVNTACRNPIHIKEGFVINGSCIRKYPAKERIEKGKLITLNIDSRSITHAYPSNTYANNIIGVSLNTAEAGEMVFVYQLDKYIDPTTCLINEISVGDKIGCKDGMLVVDENGDIGVAIRYGILITIKLK